MGPCCSVVPTGTTRPAAPAAARAPRRGSSPSFARGAGLSHRAWSWVMVVFAAGRRGGGVAAPPGVALGAWPWRPGRPSLLVLGPPWTGGAGAALAGGARRAGRGAWRSPSARLTAIEQPTGPSSAQRRVAAASRAPARATCTRPTIAPSGSPRPPPRQRRRATGKPPSTLLRPAGARRRARDERRGPRRRRAAVGLGRTPPAAAAARGDSIGSRATGYYVELEARRHSPDGRAAVAGRAHLGPPGRARPRPQPGRALPGSAPRSASRSIRRTPRRTAPTSSTTRSPPPPGRRLLFSVQPVPPEQGSRQGAGLRAREPARHLARARSCSRSA